MFMWEKVNKTKIKKQKTTKNKKGGEGRSET